MVNTLVNDTGLLVSGYVELLDALKNKIRSSQLKASISVNIELIQLYWEIGGEIL